MPRARSSREAYFFVGQKQRRAKTEGQAPFWRVSQYLNAGTHRMRFHDASSLETENSTPVAAIRLSHIKDRLSNASLPLSPAKMDIRSEISLEG